MRAFATFYGFAIARTLSKKSYSNYSSEYSNLYKHLQEIAHTSKQNMGFLSLERTAKNNRCHIRPLAILSRGEDFYKAWDPSKGFLYYQRIF